MCFHKMKGNERELHNCVQSCFKKKKELNEWSFKDPPPPQLNVTLHAHFQFDASKMLKKRQQPSGKEQKKPAGKSHTSLA